MFKTNPSTSAAGGLIPIAWKMFDSDIQPLVLSAAGALPGAPPDTPFAFLHSSAVRTGYDKRATRKLMMHVLGFDTPVACAS